MHKVDTHTQRFIGSSLTMWGLFMLIGCFTPGTDIGEEPGEAVPGKMVCNPTDLDYLYTSDEDGNPVQRASSRCASKTGCEVDAQGQASCRCKPTGNLSCKASKSQFATSLYDDTYLVVGRECSDNAFNEDDVLETCGFGTVCYVDDYDENGHTQLNDGQAFCSRSVTDEDSPYSDFGCDGAFTEFIRYPTALEVDCRCRLRTVSGSQEFGGNGSLPADPAMGDRVMDELAHPKGSITNCASPDRVDSHPWPVPYGDGPVLSDYNKGDSTWYGAEFDPQRRELYALILWGNSNHEKTAAVVAWNVDTKNRRIVTGWLPQSITGLEKFGSGYESPDRFTAIVPETVPLKWADNLRLASDGNLYVSSEHEIVRVDRDSGERTLVWQRQVEGITGDLSAEFGQCFRPDYRGVKDGLQMEKQSFAIGPDMAFYKGFRDGRGGTGILKISPDASTCTLITRRGDRGDPDPSGNGVPPADDMGNGPSLNERAPYHGMLFHDDALFVVISNALYRVDLSTGDYRRIDDTTHNATIGYTSMFWDPNLEVIWASGSIAAIFGGSVIDLESGQKELIVSDTGSKLYSGAEILKSVLPGGGSGANTGGGATSNNNSTQFGGVIVDPENPDIAYGVTAIGALIKFELSTFNNYIHSWGQH